MDEYNWPLCTNGGSHNIRGLLLAQIIPQNELLDLADKLHKLRLHLNLNQWSGIGDKTLSASLWNVGDR